MGHEILTATRVHGGRRINQSNKIREIHARIADIRDLTEEAQKARFSVICEKYGRRLVLRACCDLIVLSSGEDIPLPIWDFASQRCSRTPSLDPAIGERITEKQMTKLFRNCIVKEKWDGARIIARQKR